MRESKTVNVIQKTGLKYKYKTASKNFLYRISSVCGSRFASTTLKPVCDLQQKPINLTTMLTAPLIDCMFTFIKFYLFSHREAKNRNTTGKKIVPSLLQVFPLALAQHTMLLTVATVAYIYCYLHEEKSRGESGLNKYTKM